MVLLKIKFIILLIRIQCWCSIPFCYSNKRMDKFSLLQAKLFHTFATEYILTACIPLGSWSYKRVIFKSVCVLKLIMVWSSRSFIRWQVSQWMRHVWCRSASPLLRIPPGFSCLIFSISNPLTTTDLIVNSNFTFSNM